MWEQSKAARRRYFDGAFHSRYFVGRGMDIGGKPDPLSQYVGVFPRLLQVAVWDIENGDAQYMQGVPDGTLDFVHSSHCLEHMVDPKIALGNWLRILKPGGFLIVTVPDEDLYELGVWPSRFNNDHKWSFTIAKSRSPMARSLNLVDLLVHFQDQVACERIQLISDFFRQELAARQLDQTMTPVAECAIEFVWRKR
jgi:ubiquinone/menaquinone biosynthesis C-methylase UbiE